MRAELDRQREKMGKESSSTIGVGIFMGYLNIPLSVQIYVSNLLKSIVSIYHLSRDM